MTRPTIVLFDIDGTLITTGGVGRDALERAFGELYGRADACNTFRFDGMTDRNICRLALQAIGEPLTDPAVEKILATYVKHLEDTVRRAPEASYRVHRGMIEAVDAAHRAGMAVGLGTGNIREGARVKLQRVSLWERFGFGGFGDDHEERPALIRRGAERGAELLGVRAEDARVVVIGDTPKDVHAAQAIGAECIGVATGAFSVAQLLEAGADSAFEDLGSEGALGALLTKLDR